MIGLRCHDKPHGGQSFGTSDSTTTVTNGPVLGLDTPVQWTKIRESCEALESTTGDVSGIRRSVCINLDRTPFESDFRGGVHGKGDLSRLTIVS